MFVAHVSIQIAIAMKRTRHETQGTRGRERERERVVFDWETESTSGLVTAADSALLPALLHRPRAFSFSRTEHRDQGTTHRPTHRLILFSLLSLSHPPPFSCHLSSLHALPRLPKHISLSLSLSLRPFFLSFSLYPLFLLPFFPTALPCLAPSLLTVAVV